MEGLVMKYFILKPRSKSIYDRYAHASRMAMISYAKHIAKINTDLADELLKWVDKETDKAIELAVNENCNFVDVRDSIL